MPPSLLVSDEPNMSDQNLLVSVEDLINMAMSMGPPEANIINFKLVQTILHILARQMRLLEQKVVIGVGELASPTVSRKKDTSTSQSTSDGSKKARGAEAEPGKSRRPRSRGRDKEEKEEREMETGKQKEKGKGKEKDKATEKEKKEAEKEAEEARKGGKGAKQTEKEAKQGAKEGRESEKAGKQTEKEAKQAEKEAKQAEKEAKKGKGKDAAEHSPVKGGSIKVKVEKGEKGHKSHGADLSRRPSIEVVTKSQFARLEAAVAALRSVAGPPPPPALPDNEQLRSDLAKGTASLTDTMQAMQVAARVQAAEQAIGRLGGLLTQLAAAGGLGDDFEGYQETDATDGGAARAQPSTTSRKSVVIKASASKAKSAASGVALDRARSPSPAAAARPSEAVGSVVSQLSRSSTAQTQTPVTHPEMAEAMVNLRADLLKQMNTLSARAATASDAAAFTAKSIAEKLEVAMRLDGRITELHSLVNDYSEQLAGFDAGLTTQISSFQEQMSQMRGELRDGLAQLASANNNAETAALMELTERYTALVADLDHVLLAHQVLTGAQHQLGVDLRSLAQCVEVLREQKADRDEVLDGLRDKADNSRLTGLLREDLFADARAELERRLELCHDKFHRQELVWMQALKELLEVAHTKADLMELLKTRDEATHRLQDIHERIKKLVLILGEPKAAILTRKLARNAVCGACLVPALMDPEDATRGMPPPLPAALPAGRGAPVGAEQPCGKDLELPQRPDLREHTCKRWVGGSHTLLTEVRRGPSLSLPPHPETTRKFVGVGADGRLYQMETELEPCVECNQMQPAAAPGTPAQQHEGAGDGGHLDSLHHSAIH